MVHNSKHPFARYINYLTRHGWTRIDNKSAVASTFLKDNRIFDFYWVDMMIVYQSGVRRYVKQFMLGVS